MQKSHKNKNHKHWHFSVPVCYNFFIIISLQCFYYTFTSTVLYARAIKKIENGMHNTFMLIWNVTSSYFLSYFMELFVRLFFQQTFTSLLFYSATRPGMKVWKFNSALFSCYLIKRIEFVITGLCPLRRDEAIKSVCW